MTTFTQARAAITRSLIERYLSAPKARWEKGEYWTLNPLRADKTIGSFHVSESGQWFDHATGAGGDLIDIIAEKHGITKLDAAKKIIEDSGQRVEEGQTVEKNEPKKKKKPEAVIPIPEDAFPSLNEKLQSDWSVKKYGHAVGGWKWADHRGVWCCTTRHERDGKKDIIPYYYGADGKWHQGCPITDTRPLYRTGSGKILIVEGEKCAEVPVEGYVVVTWFGGTGQVTKADWGALQKHEDITIWPDADPPGEKAAAYIKGQLPQAKIMRVTGKPKGWDIFDAHTEGIDLVNYIEEATHEKPDTKVQDFLSQANGASQPEVDARGDTDVLAPPGEARGAHRQNEAPVPFIHLGYDEQRHYFLPSGSQIVQYIRRGSLNKQRLLELAPLSWWMMEYPDKRGLDVDVAADTTIRESERRGIFQPSRIRGTGIWMHEGSLIINNGECVTDSEGTGISPANGHYYVKSEKRMGSFSGPAASTENGYDLIKLFTAQGFETEVESLQLLGWSLIAPFGGILKWRPHVWVTGPAKSGKSWILENLIEPMLRPFYHRGTGKTSSPGIYRAIKNTACPIVLDEMEPGRNANKDTIQKIEEKLELARNASSDFSSSFTLTSMSGSGLTEEFCVRSCFLFASILPYMTGEAIESRILVSRLKNASMVKNKAQKTTEIMKSGLYDDPMIFQRKIFRNISTIIKNIEITKRHFLRHTGDQRKSDNLAPIFSAITSLVKDTVVEDDEIGKLVEAFVTELATEKTHLETDEDRLMCTIFDYVVQLQYGEKKTIAELIESVAGDHEVMFRKFSDTDPNHMTLQQHGIKLCTYGGKSYLAVSTGHSALKKILSDTVYYGNYAEVIKRHEARSMAKSIRIAAQVHHALLLDWAIIKSKYFIEQESESEFLKNVEGLM